MLYNGSCRGRLLKCSPAGSGVNFSRFPRGGLAVFGPAIPGRFRPAYSLRHCLSKLLFDLFSYSYLIARLLSRDFRRRMQGPGAREVVQGSPCRGFGGVPQFICFPICGYRGAGVQGSPCRGLGVSPNSFIPQPVGYTIPGPQGTLGSKLTRSRAAGERRRRLKRT